MDRLGCEYFVFACMTAQLWLKMAGIQQQLGALLGSEVKQIRKTEEDGTARVSVIDVVSAITGQGVEARQYNLGVWWRTIQGSMEIVSSISLLAHARGTLWFVMSGASSR